MNVVVSQAVKVSLPGSDDLDPISVYLENFGDSRGKIIIECWGRAWSAYWPAMSGRSVEQFFVDAGVPYLIGYLDADAEPDEVNPDPEEVQAALCREVVVRRRARQLEAEEARALYERAEEVEMGERHCTDPGLISALFGCDWHDTGGLPFHIPSREYAYLEKLVAATKEGLKAYIHQQA